MDPRLGLVPLEAAEPEGRFGGKAASLAAALRAGLPVPGGVALSAEFVDRIAAGEADAITALVSCEQLPAGRMAARSSAIGEDSADASFAGQHHTVLNVTRASLQEAVVAVWASGRSESALAYRRRHGIAGMPAVGVVVQALVEPVVAGVLFTRNPLTGAVERMIEATWGLGEAVVAGLVVPDTYRLDPHGAILECVAGHKDVKVWFDDTGDGTVEVEVPEPLHRALCLTAEHLRQLHALADRCQAVWHQDLDLEWALGPDGRIMLLQSRPITTMGNP